MSENDNTDDWGDALEEQASMENSAPNEKEKDVWDTATDGLSKENVDILDKPIPSQTSGLTKSTQIDEVKGVELDSISESILSGNSQLDKNILDDIPLEISVMVGSTQVRVKDLLRYTQGSIVELDTPHDAPFIAMVNGRIIAKGDIVVINDKLGIRLTEIVTSKERLESRKELL